MNEYKNWLFDVTDRVATLTLNRAEKMNSITPEALLELRELVGVINGRSDIWAVVVASAGSHFTVGVDVSAIGMMVGQEPETYRQNLRDLQDCLDQFEALTKPTIAQIRGYCLGGGMILACCCDFRVVSKTAVFGLPEVKRSIGVIMGTQRITRVAGLAATKEMTLLAENFGAEQAQRYGLVTQLVADEALETAVSDLANKFRSLPPRAVGVAKRIIDEGYSMTVRESQDLEIEAQQALLNSADFQEAVAAFFAKRPPRYTGR